MYGQNWFWMSKLSTKLTFFLHLHIPHHVTVDHKGSAFSSEISLPLMEEKVRYKWNITQYRTLVFSFSSVSRIVSKRGEYLSYHFCFGFGENAHYGDS